VKESVWPEVLAKIRTSLDSLSALKRKGAQQAFGGEHATEVTATTAIGHDRELAEISTDLTVRQIPSNRGNVQ
jgi:hypothetical protein